MARLGWRVAATLLSGASMIVSSQAETGSASRHVWLDIECQRMILTQDAQNYYFFRPDRPMTACIIASKGDKTAKMSCEDGSAPAVELSPDEQTVVVDGVELNFYDGPLPCGASGAEWPD